MLTGDVGEVLKPDNRSNRKGITNPMRSFNDFLLAAMVFQADKMQADEMVWAFKFRIASWLKAWTGMKILLFGLMILQMY